MPKPLADGSASARPKLPPIPREPYTLPDGPEVYIRALRLDERLALRRDLAALGPAASADDAVALMVPRLLGVAVVDGEGVPIFSGDDWCQYRAEIEHARDGYGHIAAGFWSPQGELLAISRQTVVVFG